MTQTNQPPKWETENFFVDSGGFHSSLKHGKYSKTDKEYFKYLERVRPDYFALRDYPCEPELLKTHNRTVQDHQDLTINHHIQLLDKIDEYDIKAKPVPVIQGWKVSEYLGMIDRMEEQGLISDYMAIGSVCRRGVEGQIRRVIMAVHDKLPSVQLHGFGIKITALRDKGVWDALYSVDSGAWDYPARWNKLNQGWPGDKASLWAAQDYLVKFNRIKVIHDGQSRLEGIKV